MFGFSLICSSAFAHSELLSRGTDISGNQLIYDSTLDVTWYDYSNGNGVLSFEDQSNWVNSLTVQFNGAQITGWRLPKSTVGSWSYGYDGSTTAGLNITTSEMGSLYYTSLGKTGAYDTLGNYLPPETWLNENYLPFKNLQPGMYWSSTPDLRTSGAHFYFYFYSGYQFSLEQQYGAYAIAVHDGDVASIPEPSIALLLLAGLGVLLTVDHKRKVAANAF
jgi:hypothetical protein